MNIRRFENKLGTGCVFEGAETSAIAFFGNKLSSLENLATEFPSLQLIGVKQTHSDILVESPYSCDMPEADAHWTQATGVALTVRTADCVPVLVVDVESKTAVAIHAGWRGVENQIVRKSLTALRMRGFNFSRSFALIGPHIASASFEVGVDVGERLERSFLDVVQFENFAVEARPDGPDIDLKHKKTTSTSYVLPTEKPSLESMAKVHIDLLKIVRAQLASCGIQHDRQLDFPVDTFASADHHSFRRDREQAGRQQSFVALVDSTLKPFPV